MTEMFSGPLAQSIGWALLHLLWQGALVAAILKVALALMAQRSATARYAAACVALALMPLLAAATATRAYESPLQPSDGELRLRTEVMPLDLARAAAAHATRTTLEEAGDLARRALPQVVLLWLVGVTFLSIRLFLSWSHVRKLSRSAGPAGVAWSAAVDRLSAAIGLDRAIRLLESSSVEVPTVIGWLRPVIVLPASTLAGLAPEQIEMLLAHELAHIRRHDFLVNLMQSFVETLMFYHPAVWWISRRIRIERENCCDDMAVDLCGSAVRYAKALTRLEEMRAARAGLALAANGGSLITRIRRLVATDDDTSDTPRWLAATGALAVVIALIAVPTVPALAQRETEQPAVHPAAAAKPAHAAVTVIASKSVSDEEPEVAAAESDDDSDNSDDMDESDVLEAPQPPPPPPAAVPAPEAIPEPPEPPEPPEIGEVAIPAISIAPLAPAPPAATVAVTAPVAVVAPVPRLRGVSSRAPQPMVRGRKHTFAADGHLSVDDLVALRAVGITPAYVEEMRSAGFNGLEDIYAMRAVGVTTAWLREMRAAGIAVSTAEEATSLRAVGVTAAYVAEITRAGLKPSVADLTAMRAVGVTGEFIRSLAAAGYSNLSTEEVIRLRAVGVDGDYIENVRKLRIH